MLNLKGHSNEIFEHNFFSSFEPVWASDQWVKIFPIFVKMSLSYLNFSIEKLLLRSIIRGVGVKKVVIELFCKNTKSSLF